MDFSYQMELLKDGLAVCVTDAHKFGTDAFLLASFTNARHRDKIVDLGTGCGIIPIVLYKKFSPAVIYGIDIQKKAIEQFNHTVSYCKLEDKIFPIEKDLEGREVSALLF